MEEAGPCYQTLKTGWWQSKAYLTENIIQWLIHLHDQLRNSLALKQNKCKMQQKIQLQHSSSENALLYLNGWSLTTVKIYKPLKNPALLICTL